MNIYNKWVFCERVQYLFLNKSNAFDRKSFVTKYYFLALLLNILKAKFEVKKYIKEKFSCPLYKLIY